MRGAHQVRAFWLLTPSFQSTFDFGKQMSLQIGFVSSREVVSSRETFFPNQTRFPRPPVTLHTKPPQDSL